MRAEVVVVVDFTESFEIKQTKLFGHLNTMFSRDTPREYKNYHTRQKKVDLNRHGEFFTLSLCFFLLYLVQIIFPFFLYILMTYFIHRLSYLNIFSFFNFIFIIIISSWCSGFICEISFIWEIRWQILYYNIWFSSVVKFHSLMVVK